MTTRSEKWLRALLANLSLRDTDDVRCSRCEYVKSQSAFSKDKSKKNGLRTYCKACDREIYRTYYNKFVSNRK